MSAPLAGGPAGRSVVTDWNRKGVRVAALDTLRGALLILILVTHGFALVAVAGMTSTSREAIEVLFGVATPSFVLISGTLFGFFLGSRDDLARVFRGYRKRAFLFFGLGHLLLAAELYPVYGAATGSFLRFYLSRWYITDTLGVAFLLMPALLPSLRPRYRVALGVALLVASRIDVVLPWARSPQALVVHQVFFGRLIASPRMSFDCYPLIPIIADFMVGSFIGDRLALALGPAFTQRYTINDFISETRGWAVRLALLSAVLCGGWALLASRLHGHRVLQAILYPDRSFSLFPAYLAWYLVALGFLLRYLGGQQRAGRRSAPVTWGLGLLGRRSLFVFVAQYFVVQTLPTVLGHRWMSLRGLLEFLPFAVAAVFVAALAWDWMRAPRVRPPAGVTIIP